MAKYKHILLATDLSKANKAAAKEALRLAREEGCTLSLLHTIYIPAVYNLGFLSYGEMSEKLITEAKPLVKAFMKETGLTRYEAMLTVGSAKDEILKAVETHQIDLLVIGSHGEYGISELAGSTVSAVVQRAKCNVLVVSSHK